MSSIVSESFLNGQIIREPVGFEKGYWVGCPGAFYAADEKAWYLTYRIRRPRGVQPDRGGEVRIARSSDLKNFDDIWAVTKDKYNSASIERSAIIKGNDGQFRYFTSYVDDADGRWCTAMLKGSDPAKFDASRIQRVFSAKPLMLEGIKDPWILPWNGRYYMFLSVAVATNKTSDQSHSSLDIFNTGECVSATGLAVSDNLDEWHWQGMILMPPASGWDKYCRRINSVVPWKNRFYAFFDGSASEQENYEERTALAVSSDLRTWESLSLAGSIWTSPFASGSIRYLDAQIVDGTAHVFYEFARQDGAHDMRLIRVAPDALPFKA